MISEGERGRAAGDAAAWLTRLETIPTADLASALNAIAARVHELFPVDLVVVEMEDEVDPDGLTHGYCLGSSAVAQTLAPLLTAEGVDPIGIARASRESGAPVIWPRVVSEPGEIARLGRLAEAGGPAGAVHRILLDASAVAVPIGTVHRAIRGAVALVSLTQGAPAPQDAIPRLQELAPQIALVARNHQLTVRNRRNRRTLEGVIASSRMGVIVSDLRGRLSLANRAASEILGVDLEPLVGRPMKELLDERIKWRFVNPEQYAARMRAVTDDPGAETTHEEETVDGRAVEHSSSPVRDLAGGVAGRVDLLHDVTPARTALAEARRLAADRASLLEREERRAQEEMGIARAGNLMSAALTPVEIGERLLEHAHQLVSRCEKSVVLAADRAGRVLPVVSSGFAESSIELMDFRSGEGVVGRVILSGRPFICNDTQVDTRVSGRLTEPEGIHSFMHVPITVGERVYGLVSVNSSVRRAFGERELRVIEELARHAGRALRHALRFEEERHIAEVLQQALIAEVLPEIPGLELAALYEPAAGSQVGGDFYSAWPLPDGRLAVLVGDVSGKGVEAAGITAMVRYMAEGLSQHCTDPGQLVGELNELLCNRMADGSLVTLAFVMIDLARDEIRWCDAGHPPPVILAPDGEYRGLSDPDPPCGIFRGQRYRTGVDSFCAGDLLVLYTDGLIEARRQGWEFGEIALRDVLVREADQSPEGLARATYSAARSWCGGRLGDDVAIAVVKRVPSPP